MTVNVYRILISIVAILVLPTSALAETIHFNHDAESPPISSMVNWTNKIQCDPAKCWTSRQGLVSRSQQVSKNGSWSLRHELDPATTGSNQTGKVNLQAPIWTGVPGWVEAYYSAWFYLEQGFGAESVGWKNNFQFFGLGKRTVSGHVKLFIDFAYINGTIQTHAVLRDCELPANISPPQGWIHGTKGSVGWDPNTEDVCQWIQVNPIPLSHNEWFHLEVYYKAADPNRLGAQNIQQPGHVIIWQDGREIFNLSHPNLNTLTSFNGDPNNPNKWSDNAFLDWRIGAYASIKSPKTVLFTDDAMVTDYPVHATFTADTIPPSAPTGLKLQ